jgi:hypothetical protein
MRGMINPMLGTVSRRLMVEGVSRGRWRLWLSPSTASRSPSPDGGGFYDALFDQPSGQFRHAVHLVGYRAQLFVEDDLVEFLRLIVERDLQILIPEEARVREAGGEDFLVAFDDGLAAVGRIDVGGADEGVGQGPRAIAADEVFLVHAGG